MSGISEDGFWDNSGYETFSGEMKINREDIIKEQYKSLVEIK